MEKKKKEEEEQAAARKNRNEKKWSQNLDTGSPSAAGGPGADETTAPVGANGTGRGSSAKGTAGSAEPTKAAPPRGAMLSSDAKTKSSFGFAKAKSSSPAPPGSRPPVPPLPLGGLGSPPNPATVVSTKHEIYGTNASVSAPAPASNTQQQPPKHKAAAAKPKITAKRVPGVPVKAAPTVSSTQHGVVVGEQPTPDEREPHSAPTNLAQLFCRERASSVSSVDLSVSCSPNGPGAYIYTAGEDSYSLNTVVPPYREDGGPSPDKAERHKAPASRRLFQHAGIGEAFLGLELPGGRRDIRQGPVPPGEAWEQWSSVVPRGAIPIPIPLHVRGSGNVSGDVSEWESGGGASVAEEVTPAEKARRPAAPSRRE